MKPAISRQPRCWQGFRRWVETRGNAASRGIDWRWKGCDGRGTRGDDDDDDGVSPARPSLADAVGFRLFLPGEPRCAL
jgi:hypothetical protein